MFVDGGTAPRLLNLSTEHCEVQVTYTHPLLEKDRPAALEYGVGWARPGGFARASNYDSSFVP
jgi:hypothetical protein